MGLRERPAGRVGSRVLGPGLTAAAARLSPLSCPVSPDGPALRLREPALLGGGIHAVTSALSKQESQPVTLVSGRNALEYRSPTTPPRPAHPMSQELPFAQDGAISSSVQQKTQAATLPSRAGRERVSRASCPCSTPGPEAARAEAGSAPHCSPCVLCSLPNLSGRGPLPLFLRGEHTLLHLVRQK